MWGRESAGRADQAKQPSFGDWLGQERGGRGGGVGGGSVPLNLFGEEATTLTAALTAALYGYKGLMKERLFFAFSHFCAFRCVTVEGIAPKSTLRF